ncbi:N-acetyltransferase [Flammeovirgaceae bacterium SG7u.111]|nr:N-acetyltransferase [Flammeovirgaceae bacterium SG7u.132]WPO33621.1 N-acetyltransferase [Flammeovirgaceae bacterium SG7u.111]
MAYHIIRPALLSDAHKLLQLYKEVAKTVGGMAREEDEISQEYIIQNLTNSLKNGVSYVVELSNGEELVAEIHCYKLTPRVFDHVLSELTIAVHPSYQGQGLGKELFSTLLTHIEQHRPDILRVELIARESNQKAIAFYKKLGFKIEGRFERRIDNKTDTFEADIPMAWFNRKYV